MPNEAYADIVFAVNLAMDYLLMAAAGKLLHLRRPRRRLLLGAALASLMYCVLAFTLPYSIGLNLFTALAVLALGLAAAFCPVPPRTMCRLIFTIYILAFGAGGMITALMYLLRPNGVMAHFSVWILLAGTFIFYIALLAIRKYIDASVLQKRVCYTVTISLNGAKASLIGLVDTGHSLTDPLTAAPVLVAEAAAVLPCLPAPLANLFADREAYDLTSMLSGFCDSGLSARVRLLPFESVGAPNGLLIGIRPDNLTLTRDGHCIVLQSTIIGLCRTPLSNGDYNALIHPQMLNPSLY